MVGREHERPVARQVLAANDLQVVIDPEPAANQVAAASRVE